MTALEKDPLTQTIYDDLKRGIELTLEHGHHASTIIILLRLWTFSLNPSDRTVPKHDHARLKALVFDKLEVKLCFQPSRESPSVSNNHWLDEKLVFIYQPKIAQRHHQTGASQNH